MCICSCRSFRTFQYSFTFTLNTDYLKQLKSCTRGKKGKRTHNTQAFQQNVIISTSSGEHFIAVSVLFRKHTGMAFDTCDLQCLLAIRKHCFWTCFLHGVKMPQDLPKILCSLSCASDLCKEVCLEENIGSPFCPFWLSLEDPSCSSIVLRTATELLQFSACPLRLNQWFGLLLCVIISSNHHYLLQPEQDALFFALQLPCCMSSLYLAAFWKPKRDLSVLFHDHKLPVFRLSD